VIGRLGTSSRLQLLASSVLSFASTFCVARTCFGYAVIMHEAIVDAEWDDQIKPLLLERFPNATAEQLREAHAYAYGGCVIQDMGYYPLASGFFSHLTHYVRSGDFIQALFEESRDINEYAFALGALSHYVADIDGHSLAVNLSVPLLYPRLREKYGDWMTWEESPWAHSLTEFGFDTLEVVANHVAPQKYHDWIGFKVAEPALRRAFKRTYALELSDQILSVRLALASYRESASQVIPEMTEVAWALRSKELEGRASEKYHQQLYHLSRKSYQAWRKTYTRPGPGDKLTAFVFRLIPKFGPLNVIDFHTPTLQTEQLFADSLKATVKDYDKALRAAQATRFDPPNVNLDTGRPTRPGEYASCDRTYAELLHKLKLERFAGITPALRDNLLNFYSNSAENTMRRKHRRWRGVLRDRDELEAACASPEPHPITTTNACASTSDNFLHE
jgi:hypothetical protein